MMRDRMTGILTEKIDSCYFEADAAAEAGAWNLAADAINRFEVALNEFGSYCGDHIEDETMDIAFSAVRSLDEKTGQAIIENFVEASC